MITLAVITGERRLVRPFRMHDVNDNLRILECRSGFTHSIVRKMKKMRVSGYIAEKDMKLPYKRYDGSGIFYVKLPMLINKLVKAKNISIRSVAVVSGDERYEDMLFENIVHIFQEFYIISPDYDFAAGQADRLMCEYGIAAHIDEPEEMCDVEIFAGNDCCGLGKVNFNYSTKYEVNHGYKLPFKIDSRAFTEALFENGLLGENELRKLGVSIGDVSYD